MSLLKTVHKCQICYYVVNVLTSIESIDYNINVEDSLHHNDLFSLNIHIPSDIFI